MWGGEEGRGRSRVGGDGLEGRGGGSPASNEDKNAEAARAPGPG